MKKLLLVIFSLFIGSTLLAQDCSKLFISEYVEGSANNKAVEIYNPTDEAVDLSLYTVKRYSNGSPVQTEARFLLTKCYFQEQSSQKGLL